MGRFGDIKNARVSEGGVYVKPGVYAFEVLACKAGETRAGVGFFVVELKVLESNNEELTPGSVCSWMVTLDKEPALGNIKGFVAVACACDVSEVDEADVEALVAKDNPLKGTLLRASATNIQTKKNTPFTKVKWMPHEDNGAAATA